MPEPVIQSDLYGDVLCVTLPDSVTMDYIAALSEYFGKCKSRGFVRLILNMREAYISSAFISMIIGVMYDFEEAGGGLRIVANLDSKPLIILGQLGVAQALQVFQTIDKAIASF